jgi:hypothetical protein
LQQDKWNAFSQKSQIDILSGLPIDLHHML